MQNKQLNVRQDENLNKLRELTGKLPPILSEFVVTKGADCIEYAGDDGGINSIGFCLYKNDRVAVQRCYLPKGCSFPAHQHDEKEWLIVFSGEIHAAYGDKTIIMLPGQSVYFENHQVHCVSAKENSWVLGITIPAAEGYPDD
jgi:quercetin dioxygenase-like cupin family protein